MTLPHDRPRGCVVDARQDAEAARRALLEFETIAAATLTSPLEDPHDAWTLELTLVTEGSRAVGFGPAMQRTAADYGLTVREVQPRAPGQTRVLLTL